VTRSTKLLTVGHSYVVALNRRLANEISREGRGSWEVTAAAPTFLHGDLRDIHMELIDGESSALVGVPGYLSRKIHFFFYSNTLRSVLRQDWDLVHAWEEPYIVCGWQIARWTPKSVPLVFSTAQNLSKRYPPPFAQFERSVVQRSAGWIAFGETVEQVCRTRPGYGDRPAKTIPMGVDTADFAPNLESGRRVIEHLEWSSNGPPVVGYLGRFVPEKGLPMLMRALDDCRSPWRALFVGGGPMEDDIKVWGRRHGDRVRVCNGVSHEQVPAYLNAMDILVAPSQTTHFWREQFGRMLAEGFACGIPVIASDSGEIPYTVGDAGKIVGERDQAGWRQALEDVLESPSKRAEMAARGRERASQLFSWPVVVRRHLEFFDRVLASRRPPP